MRRLLVLSLLGALPSTAPLYAKSDSAWQQLFDGKTLHGWRANVMPESFTVVDGAIRANATHESSHLFYVGDLKEGFMPFKNFEFEASARSEPNSNSGIFFHTDMSEQNVKHHLAKGYEVQLNSSLREKRKTGSLYAVVDFPTSPVDESQWFRVRIKVQDEHIMIWLNDRQVVDYTEPPNVERPEERKERRLDPNGGAIALQAHDPGSIFYFKDIRVRRLP